ncbi:pseudouridine synthase [Kalaharituber pfeilii]|nr:pseudouridine synthase [Kalaharituber pfeilii]
MEGPAEGYSRRGGHHATKLGKKQKKKKKEMGRNAYSRNLESRLPTRNAPTDTTAGEEPSTKRIKLDDADAAAADEPEAEKEARLPKRKVAVLIGYSGHGYKGMQLNYPLKTIEGDLFEAFVRAGAISRANSNDPKKSSLVRCARTDKGVHAAGNVISLKLIIEDPDIVDKINSNLPDQIRVWGILRTLGSFNCYQLCDSRVYEYLIPTYVFLPPHPKSFLGRMLRKQAVENDIEEYEDRQKEVAGFWDEVEVEVDKLLAEEGYTRADLDAATDRLFDDVISQSGTTDAPTGSEVAVPSAIEAAADSATESTEPTPTEPQPDPTTTTPRPPTKKLPEDLLKRIHALHLQHKRLWRLPVARLARIRDLLSAYTGTHNFHNYTIQKSGTDASAKRHIKTFTSSEPFLVNGVEYLSLKVHGQSFMMHQIRKMVGLMLLCVRCGAPPDLIPTTYLPTVSVPIPKAPGVGLLLERPVFDNYNKKGAQFGREPIDFEVHKDRIEDFKKEFIYSRMWEEEKKQGVFEAFTRFIDGYRNAAFLYLGSKGVKVVEEIRRAGGKVGGEIVGIAGMKEIMEGLGEEGGEAEEVGEGEEEG